LHLDKMLEIIARSSVSLLNVDRCVIFLFRDGDGDRERQAVSHFGWHEELVRRLEANADEFQEVALRHVAGGACLIVADVAREEREDLRAMLARYGACSALGILLQARGRPLGLLCVDSVTRPRAFSDQDERVAMALAGQASAGIESALLYAGLEERANQLDGLYEISKVISATLDIDELCQVVYRETGRLMQADAFFVALYDAASDMVRFIYLIDDGQRFPMVTVPASTGLSGHVIRTRTPLMVSLAEAEAMGIAVEHYGDPEKRVQTLLCVPLIREGRVLGLMSTQSYRAGAYTRQHFELFMAIGNQAAIAVENAHLHRRGLDLAIVEERNRLARELHDSVTQLLFSITMTLQAGRVLLQRNPTQAEQQIDRAQQTAQEALAEMRALIHQLRPATMSERGLVAALASYLEVFRARTGIQVVFHHEGQAKLAEAQEQALFRIAQEALHNVQKHAEAQAVMVRLLSAPEAVVLEVSDDGRGLPPMPPPGRATWGLTGMRERADILGGSFEIESAPGAGTLVRVRLPLVTGGLVAATGSKEAGLWSP
jgi:signal transduction histidine kinase